MADKSSLDADKGSVGGAFHADGKVGEKAQQVGGPFDKEGGTSTPQSDSQVAFLLIHCSCWEAIHIGWRGRRHRSISSRANAGRQEVDVRQGGFYWQAIPG